MCDLCIGLNLKKVAHIPTGVSGCNRSNKGNHEMNISSIAGVTLEIS